MTDALKFIPPRVQLCDPRTGFISREWYLFLQGVFERVGGPIGPSTNDLALSMPEDSGAEETKALLGASLQDAGQAPTIAAALPPQVSSDELQLLSATVASLQDQIAELVKEVEGLRQGSLI